MSTPYHAKYLAYELTKRLPADRAEKLVQSLSNATVDLNPHQIDAALFAFRSPLSRGAILADEVGLGKTIEAGLIISQLWAQKTRRILCIVPASLRKQWNRELIEKFFLDSLIVETKSYKQLQKEQGGNPFLQNNAVVICSYEFARTKIADAKAVHWDLIVIDEAHRLRNVYKKSNKIARALRDAFAELPKILLTATPLQNSLMELFGLVTFIDPHIFGCEDSFREQFARRDDAATYRNLKSRIGPICQRTLRRQVTEYVRYTRRVSITQDFTPTAEEQALYDGVSEYLRRPNLLALPGRQKQLIILVLRKILASSSFAIGATLRKMEARLTQRRGGARTAEIGDEVELIDDVEHVAQLREEWEEPAESDTVPGAPDDKFELATLTAEIAELRAYGTLADSIEVNAKGQALLTALATGFAKARELDAPCKALIFTESRRTQAYLSTLLASQGYEGRIVLFNGTNSDPSSKEILRAWQARHRGQECVTGSPTADMRSALVEEFQDRALVMIATESAAEGVNLQFCNLVVNYDLPWNPQRIEQRIGRCHRYGQKHDVVVINFLNRANQADQRVFELLHEKFKLFDGVFGASDEVLGAIDSGVDFEKRVTDIYQTCRTTGEINTAFDLLQREFEAEIESTLADARSKLLENFDDEVQRKLKIRSAEIKEHLTRFGETLWRLTRTELADCARFDRQGNRFTLDRLPEGLSAEGISLGPYVLGSDRISDEAILYRIGHPLAEALVERAKARTLPVREVVFDYALRESKLGLVERMRGMAGWLRVVLFSITAFETEDAILMAGVDDAGHPIDEDSLVKLFQVPGREGDACTLPMGMESQLESRLAECRNGVLEAAMRRNHQYFDAETEKLDRWAEDLKENLEREIKELEAAIGVAKKEARLIADLKGKVEAQKKIKDMERSRNDKRKSLFAAQDRVEDEKDKLIAAVEARLEQRVATETIFTIRWRVT